MEGYYAVVSVLLATLVPAQLFLSVSVITIVGLCVGKEFKQFKLQRALMIAMVAMSFVSSSSVAMYSITEYLSCTTTQRQEQYSVMEDYCLAISTTC